MVIKRHLNGRTDRRAEELEGKNMTEEQAPQHPKD